MQLSNSDISVTLLQRDTSDSISAVSPQATGSDWWVRIHAAGPRDRMARRRRDEAGRPHPRGARRAGAIAGIGQNPRFPRAPEPGGQAQAAVPHPRFRASIRLIRRSRTDVCSGGRLRRRGAENGDLFAFRGELRRPFFYFLEISDVDGILVVIWNV
jgi:hypothetical protein